MFYLGSFIGSFILPRLADVIGRKRIYFFGLGLYFSTSLIYPWSTELKLNYVLIFLGGISEAGRYYVGFVFMQELMPRKYQTQVGLNIFIVHGFVKLGYDLYFLTLTKEWIYLSYISIFLAFTTFTFGIKWIPESPRYLFSSN